MMTILQNSNKQSLKMTIFPVSIKLWVVILFKFWFKPALLQIVRRLASIVQKNFLIYKNMHI